MSKELYTKLTTQSLYYENELQAEQRIAIMLNHFSTHLLPKTQEQLLDIRIDLMDRYHEYYLDNQMVRLCVQMIHIVDLQLRKLNGR